MLMASMGTTAFRISTASVEIPESCAELESHFPSALWAFEDICFDLYLG